MRYFKIKYRETAVMKPFFILIFLIICILSQSFLGFSYAVVVYPIDDPQGINVPRNLRTTQQFPTKQFILNPRGLQNLRISGSGQFSEKNFMSIIRCLPVSPDKLIVLDLRQESHGFINGQAVSWTDGVYNYANLHKTTREIESDEFQRLRLAVQAKRIILNSSDKPTQLAVCSVKTERDVVEGYGSIYIRLPVTDHNRPSNGAIDQFIDLIKNLSADQWVHMHCRAGKGRTTTFLTFFDIMQNARHVSLRDILDRQRFIGGADLTATDKKYGERKRAANDRLELIQCFYLYCQQVPNFQIRWSDWMQTQCLLVDNHS